MFGQRRHVANSVDVYGRRCHLSWQRCFSGAIMYRNPDPCNQALFTGNHWATTIQAKTALWPYNLRWFCRSDGAVAPALGGVEWLLRQLPRKPPAVHVCCHEQSCSRVGTHVVRATGKTFFPMYGIFTCIYHKNQLNVGKYTIHGSYGYGKIDVCGNQWPCS